MTKKKESPELRGKVEKKLNEFSALDKKDLFEKLDVGESGLNPVEASDRLEKYGRNIIDFGNEKSLFSRIKDAIINPFNIVLLAVAAITFVTDVIMADEPSLAKFLMLVAVIIISAVISFVQGEKSNNAAKKLQSMISNKITVIRNDIEMDVEIEEVVPGDIVKLASGDMIPGDVRFIETKDLFIDQSQLTGESNPVEKFTTRGDSEGVTDLANIGFMGSNIVSGSARAVILTTGGKTYFGSMAKSLNSYEEKSAFEQNLDSISKLLIRFMMVTVPVIFIANFITKGNWLQSLMFGITIAVGIMPEMLPVILTSSLAKGAINMSRKKTIVKRLGAIQTFGEMDIFCTDKTGTLTQDEIILEKYMDVLGREDKRILRHAFLNSYFQTGLKNLMDVAIISRAEKEELSYLKEAYIREDEIPFDFSRRRRMSVVLKDGNGKRQLITKGAVEEILSICSFIEIEGEVKEITDELRVNARKLAEDNNLEGIRVIAVAQKNNVHDVNVFGVEDESDMVLIGFVGFLDPPKESAGTAIAALKNNGVRTVVLTGDSEGVAINICGRLGISTEMTLTGAKVEEMSDEELSKACEKCDIFSKLSPYQKQRVVKMFQTNGHTVGYMGDGINDSLPLKQADIGISVDNAVDIAKEVADIILLEKDLNVLDEGVIEGRSTFANMSKYLKMSVSGNFGNMFSVLIASIFLPFLPMLPVHILVQNLLNDFAQLGMPFDHVERNYIEKPKKWDLGGIKSFMIIFGLLSTVLDALCFLVLWFVFKFNNDAMAGYFQCGWFMFGVISQTMVIHTIRTPKFPFVGDRASVQLTISTLTIIAITLLIGFTGLSSLFSLPTMPIAYLAWIAILMIIYMILAQILKVIYIKRHKEWL